MELAPDGCTRNSLDKIIISTYDIKLHKKYNYDIKLYYDLIIDKEETLMGSSQIRGSTSVMRSIFITSCTPTELS